MATVLASQNRYRKLTSWILKRSRMESSNKRSMLQAWKIRSLINHRSVIILQGRRRNWSPRRCPITVYHFHLPICRTLSRLKHLIEVDSRGEVLADRASCRIMRRMASSYSKATQFTIHQWQLPRKREWLRRDNSTRMILSISNFGRSSPSSTWMKRTVLKCQMWRFPKERAKNLSQNWTEALTEAARS